MKARLFTINYEEILKKENLNDLEIIFLLDNFLRFEFIIEQRINEETRDSVINDYLEGIKNIEYAKEYLLSLKNKEAEIKETKQEFEYIINSLHKTLRTLFAEDIVDENVFEKWLNEKQKDSK